MAVTAVLMLAKEDDETEAAKRKKSVREADFDGGGRFECSVGSVYITLSTVLLSCPSTICAQILMIGRSDAMHCNLNDGFIHEQLFREKL